jgi:hypothetical protein
MKLSFMEEVLHNLILSFLFKRNAWFLRRSSVVCRFRRVSAAAIAFEEFQNLKKDTYPAGNGNRILTSIDFVSRGVV